MDDDDITRQIALFRQQRQLYELIKVDIDRFEGILKEEGISHKWQSRIKTPQSLEDKLHKRQDEGKDIDINGLVDLVGGRIVLTTYKDLPTVQALILEHFNIEGDPVQHPTPEEHNGKQGARFRGYDGLHFRGRLKSNEEQKSRVVIEIQVVNFMMSFYHYIEHRLGYKRRYPRSEQIDKALEVFQGTTHVNALAYERLEAAIEEQLPGYMYPGDDYPSLPSLMDPTPSLEEARVRDETYSGPELLKSLFEKLLIIVADATKSQKQPTPRPSFTIPFEKDDNFVGRKDILKTIESMTGEAAGQKHVRIALVGLGGVGKSQIAIEYAYRLRAKSPKTWIFWVYSSNHARFEQCFRDIAASARIPQFDDPKANILRLVFNWLRDDITGHWLMILDNADDESVFFRQEMRGLNASSNHISGNEPLSEFLPRTPNGTILVTSRNVKAAVKLVGLGNRIEVKPMSEPEALDLLRTRIDVLDSDNNDARRLVKALDYIPLAVTQAAAYISMRTTLTSLSKYLTLFHQNETNQVRLLQDAEAGDLRRDHDVNNAVLITWEISFKQIQEINRSATDLLSIMSILDRQGIPKTLLFDDPDSLDSIDALTPLLSFALISQQAGGNYLEMHRLVQLAVRNWLEFNGELTIWESKVISKLAQAYPFMKHENRIVCEELLPHSLAALALRTNSQIDILGQITLCHNTAEYFYQGGKYEQAEEMHRRTLEKRQRVLGEEHPDTLVSMNNLASVLDSQGKYEQAEEMHRRTLEKRQRVLGEEHPSTLASMNNLASVLDSQGKYEQAEEMHRWTLDNKQRVLGEEHPSTLASMNNLASVLRSQGKYEQAEEMHRRTLEKRQRVLGEEHPDTLASMNNLRELLKKQDHSP